MNDLDIVQALSDILRRSNHVFPEKGQLFGMLADEHVASWQIAWLRNALATGELRNLIEQLPEMPDIHTVAHIAERISARTNMKELGETTVGWLVETYGLKNPFVNEAPLTNNTDRIKRGEVIAHDLSHLLPNDAVSSNHSQQENKADVLNDSMRKLQEIVECGFTPKPSHYKIIRFGKYDWRVLDEQNGKMLILCERIIERRAYDKWPYGTEWARCTLRKYLNKEFINSFTMEEKVRILKTRVINNSNPSIKPRVVMTRLIEFSYLALKKSQNTSQTAGKCIILILVP